MSKGCEKEWDIKLIRNMRKDNLGVMKMEKVLMIRVGWKIKYYGKEEKYDSSPEEIKGKLRHKACSKVQGC